MNKKILVLMSTYNGEKYIESQINSISNQKGNFDIELLIRDDGSTDKTIEIVENEQKKCKLKISLIKGINLGCNGSFLELLSYANGYDYYAFSDQDDVWLENKMKSALTFLESDSDQCPKLYGSCSFVTDENLNIKGETTKSKKNISFYNLIIQNFLPGHSQVLNQEMVDIIRSRKISVDKIFYYDSWISSLAAAVGRVYFDNQAHTLYRQHSSNEIGFGKGCFGWVKERWGRIKKGDCLKIAIQINEFRKVYSEIIDMNYLNELDMFFKSQNSLVQRVKYVFNSLLYRQSTIQTLLFKALYIIGAYNIN